MILAACGRESSSRAQPWGSFSHACELILQLKRCDEFNLHHSHQIYLLFFIEITISRETRKLVINTVVNRAKLPTNLNVVGINLFVLSQFILNISQVLVLQEF